MAEFDPDAYLKETQAFDPDAYLTGAPKAEEKKPGLFSEKPGPKRDPMSFYKTDPREYMKAQSEANLGLLSGIGKVFTGAGEALPGEAGKASARGTKALEKVGAPETQALGQALGTIAPAGALFRGISALGKGIPQLTGVLGGGQRIAGSALSGATAGGITGYATPTGEEDPAKRAREKQKAAIIEGSLGGAIGGGFRAVGEAINAHKYVAGLIKEAEALREGMKAGPGFEAYKFIQETEKEIASASARLARISDVASQLEARDAIEIARRAGVKVGEPAAALDPSKVSSLQRDAVARVRERVAAAQKAAEEAGMQRGQAADYVARQETLLLEQKAAAEGITLNLQKALEEGKSITPVELGQQIRKTAVDIYNKVKGERERVAGFGKAVKEAGDDLRVSTSDVLSAVDALKKTSNNPNLDRVLQEITNRLKTNVEGAKEPVNALSVARADSLRKYVVGLIDTSQNKAAAAQLGLDKEAVTALRKIRSSLTKETMNSWQPYKDAMVNFAKLSGPVRPFERKGSLAKVVAEDPTTRDQLATEGQIVSEVLNRSRGGQFPIATLVEQQPELRNSLRAYYHRELFEGGTPTINKLSGFLKKNEDVLKQTGLYDEFSTIKSARQAADRAVAETEGVIAAGKERVKELTGEQKRLEDILKGETRLLGRAKEREAAAAAGKPTREQAIETSEARAKEAAERLGAERVAATTAKETAEETLKSYRKMINDLDRAQGADIPVAAKKIIDDLNKRGLIDEARRSELLNRIQIASERSANADEAKKYMKQGIYAGLGFLAAGTGGSLIKGEIAKLFSGGR
jgi:hypothetical protein